MNISIDEQQQVQETLNKQAIAGIKSAFEGYSVRQVLEKSITETVIPSIITTAIEQAASQIDVAILAQHLAEEISRSVTVGVQVVMREMMVNIILDMKKIPSYDDAKRDAARLEIETKLFRK